MSDSSRVGKQSYGSGAGQAPPPPTKSTPGKAKSGRSGSQKAAVTVFIGHG